MSISLQQLIIERIGREGPISFADYMRIALYQPGYGYYVTGPARMGWSGDYYTSTDVSSLFAYCMGRQLFTLWELQGQPDPFIVLEQGAGRGNLGQQLSAWAKEAQPAMYSALQYRTEDIHAGYDALQVQEDNAPVSVLLSNELVDAFPVHIVEKREDVLYEVYVDVHHGRLHEILSEPDSAEVAGYLDAYRIPWKSYRDGWRAEINLDALKWMGHSAQILKSRTSRRRNNFLLTIDYGDKARALYTPERYRGTLACYFQHSLTERPLVRPGEQDITAHVNFSALIDEGRRNGLRLHTYTTQKEWLESNGLNEEIEQKRTIEFSAMDTERATDRGQKALLQWHTFRQGISALTDPQGMGNFKVLIMKG